MRGCARDMGTPSSRTLSLLPLRCAHGRDWALTAPAPTRTVRGSDASRTGSLFLAFFLLVTEVKNRPPCADLGGQTQLSSSGRNQALEKTGPSLSLVSSLRM